MLYAKVTLFLLRKNVFQEKNINFKLKCDF